MYEHCHGVCMIIRFEPLPGRRKMQPFTKDVSKPALRHIFPVYSDGGPCVCTPPPLTATRRVYEPRICQVMFEATGEVVDGVAVYREMERHP